MKIQRSHQVLIAIVLALLSLTGIAFASQFTARADPSAAAAAIALQPVASGFERPIHITHAGDGSGRLFVVEQAGIIHILAADGTRLAAPFLDISDRVRSPASGGGNEEGLLSVAFPPDYAASGLFYVYYTTADGNNRVARFGVTADANVADASREELILLLEHPGPSNHNGGQLAFGADGYLYIGTGDGGGGGDPRGNGQNRATLLGKLLRIDVSQPTASPGDHQTYLPCIAKEESTPTSSAPYRIPPDNPFVNDPNARPEIWAYGLRNPWRFTFDRQTADLWIADVGQGQYEEIDWQPASSSGGENYGWNVMEGSHCYNAATCEQNGLVLPVAEYDHGQGCSVTGGFTYRGSDYPAFQGIYFYADFCSGKIWGLQNNAGWQSDELLSSGMNISSFGEAENGELYLADMTGGGIYQMTAPTP
jgi:glucose/arabinose dehydrogenase